MDDLARIERIYGSVQYKNWLDQEESRYEPSDEEIIEQEIDSAVYHEQIRLLNGIADDDILALREKFHTERVPEPEGSPDMGYIYAIQDVGNKHVHDAVKFLSEKYGIEYKDSKEGSTGFYSTFKPGEFGVSVEYVNFSQIYSVAFTGLDYDTFQKVFTDLYTLRLSPTMKYQPEKGESIILSNSTLGELKLQDLKWCGVETTESLNRQLLEKGFDKNRCYEDSKKRVLQRWYGEGYNVSDDVVVSVMPQSDDTSEDRINGICDGIDGFENSSEAEDNYVF